MRSRTTILNILLLCFLIDRSSDAPVTPHIPEEHVSTSLYGSITLPCAFPFVQSQVGLTMIWDKKEKKGKQIVYWFLKGKENLDEQDPRYRGRVKLSKKFPQGNLDLILKDVTYEDEGTYYCRAANNKDDGDKKVILSIDGLDADNPMVTRVTIDGKRRWKCTGSGVYHNPQVQWLTDREKNLSSYGQLSTTNKSNGWKLVESVLDYDVEEDVEVICHIMEGRLKKSSRGIISDNEEKEESPDPEIITGAVIGTIILIICIIIVLILLYRHYNTSPCPRASIMCDPLRNNDLEKVPMTDSPRKDSEDVTCLKAQE